MAQSRSVVQHPAAQIFFADHLFNRGIDCVVADAATYFCRSNPVRIQATRLAHKVGTASPHVPALVDKDFCARRSSASERITLKHAPEPRDPVHRSTLALARHVACNLP